MGDMNFDPFTGKGSNKRASEMLHSHPHLYLVQKTRPEDCTRPRSGSHIDNIVISKSLLTKVCSKVVHLEVPSHGSGREPSDNKMIGVITATSGKRPRQKAGALKYDVRVLRECAEHAYTQALHAGCAGWQTWAKKLRAAMENAYQHDTQAGVHACYEGLKMIVYSAA